MAKKDFSKVDSNPGYISSRRALALAEDEPAAPIRQKDNAQEGEQKERYSRHLQSLIKPSTYEALAQIAKRRGESVNAILNEALEQYIRQ